jgi:phage-related protein
VPKIRVIFYKDEDQSVPMIRWLDKLQKKPRAKCIEWLHRLEMLGHDLHRPYADTLKDGIHELRVRHESVNYRMLYFFHGTSAVVVTHGLTKEKEVPVMAIQNAVDMKNKFMANPESHTFYWEV